MANTAPAKQAREQLEILADKDADSTDSDVRYMAYGARLRTVLRAGQRYIAYAYRQGPSPLEAAHFSEPTRVGMVAVKRAVFQSVASMALPAFTIHTAVKQSKKAFANVKNPRIKTWGPTATGLAIVPILPYLFDKPVEHATDFAFDWIEKKIVEMQTKANTGEKTEL
ncbi:hypothetical protein PHLCEN_2v10739 [Hermanssonia centrifuga]|uniref:Mitochondrial fission process protein 1 n=1 Tax=Hermanssonia centrifuga TaxID=98765 RepID=A0A2R6NM30_9APHY|nr:hypothetical protein PHLCEN_2v10739 [Hermanssonia centrifuga]